MGNEKTSIVLWKIFGIPIRVDLSWIILYAFLTLVLAIGYYPVVLRGRPSFLYWFLSALTILILFGSLLVHEFGHALIAHYYRIPVTVISMYISGGEAHMPTLPSSAPAEFWIASAGPLANIGIAAILTFLRLAIDRFLGPNQALFALFKVLIAINAAIAIFNLLPVLPLDGGRAFRAIIWRSSNNPSQATRLAGVEGQFVAYIFIVFGVIQVFSGNLIYGLWVVVTGFILDRAASYNNSKQDNLGYLKSRPVSDIMSTKISALPADITIHEFYEHIFLRNAEHAFILKRGDRPVGLLTLKQLGLVSRSKWHITPISQIMIPLECLKWVEPHTEFWQAMRTMDVNRIGLLPVIQDGVILGTITRGDLLYLVRKLGEQGGNL